MQKQQAKFNRKKLAIAVSVAMLGGVLSGCNENDPIAPDALGEYSILANGGTGGMSFGNGGNGGAIDLIGGGSGGVEISRRGMANAKFSTPFTPQAVNLGDNPLNITADTTIPCIATVADLSGSLIAGDLYVGTDGVLRSSVADGVANYANDTIVVAGTVYLNNSEVFVTDGTATADAVYTGLSVAAGTTLTLGHSEFSPSSSVEFANDIDNSGTITKVIDITSEGSSLTLRADKYVATGSVLNAGSEEFENGGSVNIFAVTGISNSGTINTSGFDEDDEIGGSGGSINLNAAGYVINSGELNTSGGNGSGTGGSSAGVSMNALYTENTGAIHAGGGDNVSLPLIVGPGGNGGEVRMIADYFVNNSADIDTSGGNGSSGGTGRNILLSNVYSDFDGTWNGLGDVKNAGNLTMSGGAAGLDDASGYGGMAGELIMLGGGGDVLSSGNLTAVGGDSAYSSGSHQGISGGNVGVWGGPGEVNTPAGNIMVSGDINISGGHAVADGSGYGGNAGNIDLVSEVENQPDDQRVALLGYVSIDANGGDGYYGGRGAAENDNDVRGSTPGLFPGAIAVREISDGITLTAEVSPVFTQEGLTLVAGSAVNDVPINARGGNGVTDATTPTANYGGTGGYIEIVTTVQLTSVGDLLDGLDVTGSNTAAIDVSGGNASANSSGINGAGGGTGGRLEVAGYHAGTNSGAVTANGGAGGEYGGSGGGVDIYSEVGQAANSAVIANSGGSGARNGGWAGSIDIAGATAANSGDITSNGGNATSTDELVTTYGGRGGNIVIVGAGLDAAATNSGNVSYAPGTASDYEGGEGCLQVGLSFTGDCSGGNERQ